eukprot:3389419-Prymnesium_polylepis.1
MTKEHEELLPTKLEKPPPFLSTVSPMDLFTEMDKVRRSRASQDCASSVTNASLSWHTTAARAGRLGFRLTQRIPGGTQRALHVRRRDREALLRGACAWVTRPLISTSLPRVRLVLFVCQADADNSGEVSLLEWSKA